MSSGECPLCGPETKSDFIFKGHAEGILFTYWRCSQCGLVFLSPLPNEHDMVRIYPEDYYGEGPIKFRSWLEPARLFFAARRAARVRRYFFLPGRVLDVGCGQGTFLSLLRKEGWECHGTEISQESALRACRAGIPVSVGEINENQFPPASLEIVTLWHVLEHLRDPLKTLKRIRPMMKKGSILAISTPNISSLQARVSGTMWFHLDPPRHFHLFSPETLRRLIEPLGFRLVEIHHFSMEQNPYGWLQSMLNVLGLPKNSLYTLLKNLPKKGKQRLPFLGVKTLMLAAGLFPTCFLLSLVMAVLNWGGTIEAYFQLARD